MSFITVEKPEAQTDRLAQSPSWQLVAPGQDSNQGHDLDRSAPLLLITGNKISRALIYRAFAVCQARF